MRDRTDRVHVAGREFEFRVTGPTARGRYEVRIRERGARGDFFAQPIVGLSREEARDRAVEALTYVASVERLRRVAEAAAAELLPGARVTIAERAAGIHVELEGGWALREPLALTPDEALEADDEALLRRVFDHLERHRVRR